MKMKEFGPRGGARVPGAPLDPPCLNIHAENFSGGSRISREGEGQPQKGGANLLFFLN